MAGMPFKSSSLCSSKKCSSPSSPVFRYSPYIGISSPPEKVSFRQTPRKSSTAFCFKLERPKSCFKGRIFR